MRRAALLLPGFLLVACGQVPIAAPSASFAEAGVPPVCGLSPAQLGTPIASEAGYTVHDTAPGTDALRVHHVTGFDDGCAREVTAALVLFGDVATHETTRYDVPEGPYSPSDVAYEEIKGQVCGVPAGQPCGARLDRLAQDTVFLSLYPSFEAEQHTDLLLHAGEVAAVDTVPRLVGKGVR
jgi:hypothetical protein